jgi:hypothetical protein
MLARAAKERLATSVRENFAFIVEGYEIGGLQMNRADARSTREMEGK